jgi:AAHS family 3-hydroxyphenylpropionic acid transporter
MNAASVPVYARRALIVCFLVALCEGIDLQAAGVAAAGISREFLPTVSQKGVFFGASTFGLFLGALFGGWIADGIGRKKVLVTSIAVFGLFSVLTAFAPGMTVLTVARLLTGLGLGGALPNLIAVAAEASTPQRRNANIVAMYVGMPLGGVIASAIILCLDVSQWRTVFIAGGVAPLLILPLMVAFMPVAAPTGHGGATSAFSPEAVRELFGAGRAARTFLLWLACFLALVILYMMLNWLPTLLQGIGLSNREAAGAQIAFNAGGAACSVIVGRLLDSRARMAAIVATFVAVVVALLGLANLGSGTGSVWVLTLLLGGGVVSSQGILYGIAADCYSAAHRGAGVGSAIALGRVGSFVGPLLAAVLVGSGRSSAQVLTNILPIVILCALCVLYLGRRRTDVASA